MPHGIKWDGIIRGATRLLISEMYSDTQVQDKLWKQFAKERHWKAPPSTRWIRSVRKCPLGTPASERKKLGRKRILSDKNVKSLHRIIRYNHKDGRWLTPTSMRKELGVLCHERTVRRELRRIPGARPRKPQKKLYLSELQKKKRRKFVIKAHNKSLKAYWKTITYIDEKKFSMSGPDSMAPVWTLGKKRVISHQQPNNRQSVFVWAGLGPQGLVGPEWVQKTMKGPEYVKILEKYEAQLQDRIMDDGAGCHIANITRDYLEEAGITRVSDDCGRAPKLVEINKIENVWPMLESRVHRGGAVYREPQQLWEAIEREADKMKASGEDKKLYHNMTNNIPQKLRAIKAAQGGAVK